MKVTSMTNGFLPSDTADFMASMKRELFDLDPVAFIENNLTVQGDSYQLTNCGRDYLHDILRYIAFEATTTNGLPVVVVKGRQVEMTTTATSLSAYFMCGGLYHHVRGIHAFPQIQQAHRHSNEQFDRMIKESVDGRLRNKKDIRTAASVKANLNKGEAGTYSVTQKTFDDGNVLYIEGASKNGDRLRGIPADFVLFDEMQDISTSARDNVDENVSHSKFGPAGKGLQLYFGTPKEKGTTFWEIWTQSDQRIYYLKCPHCGHYSPITFENFETGFMMKCLDMNHQGCNQLFDKRIGIKEGEWRATNHSNVKYRGYHISQLLIPIITAEAIRAKKESKSPRAYANEVEGQFYAGDSDTVSYQQVIGLVTTQPDTGHAALSSFVKARPTFMGVDWGGRVAGEDDQGQGGYTVVTILSQAQDGRLSVDFCERLKSNIVDDNVARINDLIRPFNCQQVCCDQGYGHAAIQRLQSQWGDIVRPVFSSGNMKKTYNHNKESGLITIDKSKAFQEFWDILLQHKLSIPYSQPEKVEWLFEHISNVEIVTKKFGGMLTRRFEKQSPSRPIDGLASLVYAYVACQFKSTSGFTMKADKAYHGTRNMPKPIGATLPVSKKGGISSSHGRRRKITRHHRY